MRRVLRSLPWVIGLPIAAALPLNAELFMTLPRVAAAFAATALASLPLFRSSRKGLAWTGALLCVGAAVTAPGVAWPAALLPLGGRRLGRLRFVISTLALALAGWLAVSGIEGTAIADRLIDRTDDKLLEAGSLVGAMLTSLVSPASTPWLGPAMGKNHAVGLLVLVVAVFGVGWLLASGITRRWQVVTGLGMAGVLSTVSGALLDRPRPAYGALFAGTLVVATVLLVTRLAIAPKRSLVRVGFVSAALVAAFLPLRAAVTETRARASVWRDQDRAWAKILDGSPASDYRWDYAVVLKESGRLAEYRDQVQIYFERNGGDPRRRLDFALALLHAGDEDRAFSHLVALKNKPLPSRIEDATRVLDLLERRGALDLAFDLVERVPALPEAAQVRMAKVALEQKRKETFATLRTRLLALPRPPLQAFELAYRDGLARQDVELLRSIGERATTLYEDEAVGYAAHGKIAKIYRRDDEMLAWHGKALARDKSLFDLHYDMGLVLHGRADRLLEAATHYEKVLELCPDHPRRSTIEGWIQALRTEAKANGG